MEAFRIGRLISFSKLHFDPMLDTTNCNSRRAGYPVRGRRGGHKSLQRLAVTREEASMAKSKKGLDNRHRDKTGRIERKHGNTKVAALRKEYGPGFAKGRRKDMMLKTLLKETGSNSLHDYLRHHHR